MAVVARTNKLVPHRRSCSIFVKNGKKQTKRKPKKRYNKKYHNPAQSLCSVADHAHTRARACASQHPHLFSFPERSFTFTLGARVSNAPSVNERPSIHITCHGERNPHRTLLPTPPTRPTDLSPHPYLHLVHFTPRPICILMLQWPQSSVGPHTRTLHRNCMLTLAVVTEFASVLAAAPYCGNLCFQAFFPLHPPAHALSLEIQKPASPFRQKTRLLRSSPTTPPSYPSHPCRHPSLAFATNHALRLPSHNVREQHTRTFQKSLFNISKKSPQNTKKKKKKRRTPTRSRGLLRSTQVTPHTGAALPLSFTRERTCARIQTKYPFPFLFLLPPSERRGVAFGPSCSPVQ